MSAHWTRLRAWLGFHVPARVEHTFEVDVVGVDGADIETIDAEADVEEGQSVVLLVQHTADGEVEYRQWILEDVKVTSMPLRDDDLGDHDAIGITGVVIAETGPTS